MESTLEAVSSSRAKSYAAATVFVVDDDAAVRESLVLLFRSKGLRVATFATAEAFLRDYDRSQLGCLLLDIRMPGMGGLELHDELRSRRIRIPVIIMTGHGDIPTAVRAMRGGVFDFIEKPFETHNLVNRIRRAIELDAKTKQREKQGAVTAARIAQLPPREVEVLRLLAEGFSSKQVAAKLSRSDKTIDRHKANLMKKLDVHDRVDLVRLAIRAGLADL